MTDHKRLFDAVREVKGAALTQADVERINAALGLHSAAPSGPDPAVRRTSQKGRDLITHFEGERLRAYRCPAGVWTIGIGHTGPDVTPGKTISREESQALLTVDLAKFEAELRKLAPVTTQGQFDALVSFAFNLGEGNLAKSTLLKKHNAGDHGGAAAEFGKWVHADGKRMEGLVRRRAAEARLYQGKEWRA